MSAGAPTPTISLDMIAASPALAADLPVEAAWHLYGQAITGLLALLPQLRPLESPGAEAASGDDPLLTPREVATILNVPRSYVYELIRRGELPRVRVGPKYRRIRPAAVRQWLAEREAKKPLFPQISRRYTLQYEGQGAPGHPPAVGADPGPVRPGARGPQEHRRPVGARRAPDPGADRSARPASGRRRPAPAPPDDDSDETKW